MICNMSSSSPLPPLSSSPHASHLPLALAVALAASRPLTTASHARKAVPRPPRRRHPARTQRVPGGQAEAARRRSRSPQNKQRNRPGHQARESSQKEGKDRQASPPGPERKRYVSVSPPPAWQSPQRWHSTLSGACNSLQQLAVACSSLQ